MNASRQMNSNQIRSMISIRFLRPGFDFWFSDHEHIRSPFPKNILETVEERTTSTFFEWIGGFREDELYAMEEKEIVEMFETILFNEAFKLVEDEDQQLSISYPFLPRLGDQVNHQPGGPGKVINRKAIATKENKTLMELTVFNHETEKTWQTCFELTA